MHLLDVLMVVAYFGACAVIGYWASRRSTKSSQEYFLSGRDVGWLAVGASLFSANISAEHFIGLSGSGAASGLAVGQFEWIACFVLLLLGWLFVPFYLRTGVFTMPEFLERRYNPACRGYLSAVSLLAYVFTKISVALYAGALVFREVLNWNIYLGAAVLIVATAIYTIAGGLRAVIYTELMQAFVLIGGAAVLTWIAVDKAGGISELVSATNPEYFNLWKPATHPDFPWTGILFGAPILGIWYWCTDQMIVQRTLAAKDLAHARGGTIFAGFLKLLPVLILVLPGIAGAKLFPDIDVTRNSDGIYPRLVNELMPIGLKGLLIAALLAALMSSLSAVYNSSSTLVVMDFYTKLRPGASEREKVRAGQVSTVALVVLGFAWLPFLADMSKHLFVYLQSVQAYVSPPIAAVFLMGLLWKRANGSGALAALLVGFVLGAARFVAEVAARGESPTWLSNAAVQWFVRENFLHFAAYLFVVSVVVHALVSLATAPPKAANLAVFQAGHGAQAAIAHPRRGLNIVLSVVLVLTVLTLWIYFSPLFWSSTQ